jgi:hypothetical protein
MARTRKYYLKNHYLTLRSKVKVPRRSLWYVTPPYGHAPTYQISLTYLERQKCYGPDKKILFKKPLFDLEVKGQGPMKVITVCDTPPYGHAPTYQISLTYIVSRKKQLLDLEIKGQGPVKVITVCNTKPYGHASTYQISLTYLERQKCYGPDKKNYLKNNYLTLRSKVKVQRRS